MSARSRPTRCCKLLKLTGDWQKFKGEPAPAPLKVAEPKADRHAVYEAAAKEALSVEAATTAEEVGREGRCEGRRAAPRHRPSREAAEPSRLRGEAAAEEKPEGEA